MRVERLDCPRGSVVVFKNKSAHAVEPKPVDSVTTRWNFGTVITNRLQSDVVRLRFHIDDPVQAWKNDGHTSHRGSMTPAWAQRRVRGSAGALMPPVTARDAVTVCFARPTGRRLASSRSIEPYATPAPAIA